MVLEEVMALCIVFLMYSSCGNYFYRRSILKLIFSCPGITVTMGSMDVCPSPLHAGDLSDTRSFVISFV